MCEKEPQDYSCICASYFIYIKEKILTFSVLEAIFPKDTWETGKVNNFSRWTLGRYKNALKPELFAQLQLYLGTSLFLKMKNFWTSFIIIFFKDQFVSLIEHCFINLHIKKVSFINWHIRKALLLIEKKGFINSKIRFFSFNSAIHLNKCQDMLSLRLEFRRDITRIKWYIKITCMTSENFMLLKVDKKSLLE